jgi:hypothetical protein
MIPNFEDMTMPNSTYSLRPLLADIRHGYRGMRAIRQSLAASRREERYARRALERELATYTSPGDREDLEAMLDRYPEEQTADIRRILAARR